VPVLRVLAAEDEAVENLGAARLYVD